MFMCVDKSGSDMTSSIHFQKAESEFSTPLPLIDFVMNWFIVRLHLNIG